MNNDIITLAALLVSIRSMLIMMEESSVDHTVALHSLIDRCEHIVQPYLH